MNESNNIYCGKLIRRTISDKVKVLMIFTVNVFKAIPDPQRGELPLIFGGRLKMVYPEISSI
ncbi:hypothetical protein PAS25_15935 [Leclercia adecarboxylata]|uniref:Uncharacterized protein n=1 Tax=Leclercia barmai TaxID=2785629 RepID=A0ABS7RUG8_9ENTR|nr:MULTISPECIES: hypothetical protein [Enterobacteriaceae]MBZ0057957.1 hypothetical protein [Leclercia sp. EMC7]MCM5696278.1 hypothetical protein [Leclercia sp. LTM01]MCM5700521.1 hypothetical protein [Leclercia sp. LTM14]QCZ27552.1 hypothetical protein FHN83_13310 [Leclercia adecarboxylata]TLU67842.1 hypothetical protein FFB58_12590 [Enterobacter sp. MF024]